MASTFPPSPAGARLARPARRESSGLASLAEIMADVSSAHDPPGASADTPRAPQGHFFPSVPRAQRDVARKARLAGGGGSSPEPITSSTPPPLAAPSQPAYGAASPSKVRGIDALLSAAGGTAGDGDEDDKVRRQRARDHQARLSLASTGLFDPHGRRPSLSSQHSFASAAPSTATAAADEQDFEGEGRRGVGAGGSGGTKRPRDGERAGRDAASEAALDERDRRDDKGKGREVDREKTPTPNVGGHSLAPPVGRAVSFQSTQDTAMSGHERSVSPGASSKPPSVASTERDDDATMDDDASVMTSRTGATGVMADDDDDGSGKEPAKKRSRTLTTPAQTAVLNALLAKTRFPSTETREEVGKQIGMSARRVQIWFQNRRQSQKRQRDREAQEAAAASAVQAAAMAAGHHHAVYGANPQMGYAVDSYGRAAHFYPPVQLKPHPQSLNGGYPPRPDVHRHPSMESISGRSSYAPSQHSVHSLHGREGVGQRSVGDQRYAHPYATSGAAAYAAYGQQQHQQSAYSTSSPYASQLPTPPAHLQQQHQSYFLPPKVYFPSIPRSHAPSGRLVADPYRQQPTSPSASGHGAAQDRRLPSLSSVLHSGAPSAADPTSHQQAHAAAASGHQPMFSHSPFSPPAAAYNAPPQPGSRPPAQPQPGFSRSLFSPEPSSSFERLRISGGPLSPSADAAPLPFPPPSTTSSAATTPAVERAQQDVLDVAMDRMAYRAHGGALPARQTLPPLRAVFGDSPVNAGRAKKGGPSEADKALLAPIGAGAGPSGPDSADGPPRLAPIQTFAPLASSSSPVSPHSHVPAATASAGALSPHDAASAAGAPATSRASTWSDMSHATRSSAASFEFGAPPPGSYRSEHSSVGLGRTSGSGERPLPPVPAEGREHAAAKDGRAHGERDASVETEETSAATSVSSEGAPGVKA